MRDAITILQKAILDRMQENAGPEINGFIPLINFNKPITDPYIIELTEAIRVLENHINSVA